MNNENNGILNNAKELILEKMAIDLIQTQITDEEIVNKVFEVIARIGGGPISSKKIDFSEVPVNWHRATKRRTSYVLSDGATKEGFFNYSTGDKFLNQPSGYLAKQIRTGGEIKSYPDMKTWHVIEMEGKKYG